MRRFSFIIVFFLSIWILLSVRAQDQRSTVSFKNIVTGLAIKSVNNSSVEIEWKSDIPRGIFNIYRNPTNAINTRSVLKESELVGTLSLQGQELNGYFIYNYIIPMNARGKYYFSVIADQGMAFDDAIRLNIPDVNGKDYSALPSLNYTLQPVYFNLKKQVIEYSPVPYLPYRGYFITSLDLFAEEDIFRLTWKVYPKDLDQYIFKIYRSRYPLSQFGGPQGMPEYARVTNRFYFEDRNISFETPYYYAVVAEGTVQWDIGINLFSRPAVVVRDAPPYQMPAQIEFAKYKSPLPIWSVELLSEDAIQKAVNQTLSNLQIAPIRRNTSPELPNSKDNNPLDLTPLTPNDITNGVDDNYFLQQKQIFRAGNLENGNNFMLRVRNAFDRNVSFQEALEQKVLNESQADYVNFLRDIVVIENRVVLHKNRHDRLLRLDYADEESFKEELNDYFNDRDQIRLLQFNAKALVHHISNIRFVREEKLLTDLQKIQDDWEREQSNFRNEAQAFQFAHRIADKWKQLDPKKISIQPVLGTVSLDSLYQIQTSFVDGNLDHSEFVEPYVYEMPKQIPPEKRVERVRQYYYGDVSVEKVPTLDQNPPEVWFKSFEFWLRDNPDLWQEKIKWLRDSVPTILGDQYYAIQSRWLYPSPDMALREGMKAVQEERYAEAIYLLVLSPRSPRGLMLLGESYYHMGAYREAFSVFLTATSMCVPNAKLWMELSAEKILQRHLREAS